jgi:16S rRNA processing protein RimM
MGSIHQSDSPESRGSGRPPQPAEPRLLAVGRVLRPHGLRGELRVELLTDYPERFALHRLLYLGPTAQPYELEAVRFHKEAALIKLVGCDDRDAAGLLRGQLVQIPMDQAVPLEDGEYYLFQVIGLEVVTDAGESLGRVVEVIDTHANDVYLVRGPRGEVLLPAIADVVQEIDWEARRIRVTLLPGLLGDE